MLPFLVRLIVPQRSEVDPVLCSQKHSIQTTQNLVAERNADGDIYARYTKMTSLVKLEISNEERPSSPFDVKTLSKGMVAALTEALYAAGT